MGEAMKDESGRLDRRDFLKAALLGSAATLLAACQGPAPAPTAAPAISPTSPPKADSASTAPAWEKRWNELVEAARKEGRLVVSGPPTPEVRTQLPEAFRKRFGIDIEYIGGRTGDLMNRLKAERAAGQYTVDALLSGATSLYTVAHPEKMLDPIPPVVIHPEAIDGSRWVKGRLWFMDPEQQYIVRLSNYVSSYVVVNTDFVDPNAIKSWNDLLDPRWKGKISVYDPTVSGTGSNTAAYLRTKLGEDYVRRLYQDQQPGVSREDRQLSDWMARGTYPISLGLGSNEIETLKRDGFRVAVLPHFPEAPPYVTAGFGLLALLNNAPHPNAAKLFINWMLMKEGNEVFNRAQVLVSTRTDVDNSWVPDYMVPKPGVEYFDTFAWEFTARERDPASLARIRELTQGRR